MPILGREVYTRTVLRLARFGTLSGTSEHFALEGLVALKNRPRTQGRWGVEPVAWRVPSPSGAGP
jgi:hypothetical protein